MNPVDRRILTTHVLDQLDAAVAPLEHWLRTGERVECKGCARTVPSSADHTPVWHRCPADQVPGALRENGYADMIDSESVDDLVEFWHRAPNVLLDDAAREVLAKIEARVRAELAEAAAAKIQHCYTVLGAKPGSAVMDIAEQCIEIIREVAAGSSPDTTPRLKDHEIGPVDIAGSDANLRRPDTTPPLDAGFLSLPPEIQAEAEQAVAHTTPEPAGEPLSRPLATGGPVKSAGWVVLGDGSVETYLVQPDTTPEGS